MKCTICNKEFIGRSDAKYCSSTCRSKASRATDNATDNTQNATVSEISVAKPQITTAPKPDDATDKPDYYHSKEYLDLIKHLEDTPLAELKKEGIFIPAWKYAGMSKKPNISELMSRVWQ